MAEYIERSAAVKAVLRERSPANSVAQNRKLSIIQHLIENAPTVDAVVVTRCKDCKYYNPDEYECGCDFAGGLPYVKPDDFCSYGEPKEG